MAPLASAPSGPAEDNRPPPKDLSHLYSDVSKARVPNSLKQLYKYFAIPGIAQFAGGTSPGTSRCHDMFSDRLFTDSDPIFQTQQVSLILRISLSTPSRRKPPSLNDGSLLRTILSLARTTSTILKSSPASCRKPTSRQSQAQQRLRTTPSPPPISLYRTTTP